MCIPGYNLSWHHCRYRQFKESSLRDPLETADLPVSTGAEWGLQKSRWGASKCAAILTWTLSCSLDSSPDSPHSTSEGLRATMHMCHSVISLKPTVHFSHCAAE